MLPIIRLTIIHYLPVFQGTAFVKFAIEESAIKCIEASAGKDGLFLDGRQLYAMAALQKENADEVQKQKKEKIAKDGRNLYLAREGLVREGTLAAESVSKEDMTKRNQLAKWKKGMLKDLNMFVSPVRLCVRNLPPHIDDKKLKGLMLKYAEDPVAKITESKVMRDFKQKNVDVQVKGEVGASKGYGFLTYTTHDAALNALRKVNNNPNVFRKEQRPIVEFSIENRNALNARQKRLEKSREKNPTWKGGSKDGKTSVVPKYEKPDSSKTKMEGKSSYSGSFNNPKQKNLPSHEGPKLRHNRPNNKISRKDLKRKEQEKRHPKKRKRGDDGGSVDQNEPKAKNVKTDCTSGNDKKEKKRLSRKQAKKQKTQSELRDIKEEKQFASLVASYKRKLVNNDSVSKRSKWFA